MARETQRRTEIRIETSEVLMLRTRRLRFSRAHCPQCETLVSMVSLEEAATVTGEGEREICRWVERRKVHFTETRRGRLLICADSLMKAGASERGVTAHKS
jgi:uncharacterized protein with PIN domain